MLERAITTDQSLSDAHSEAINNLKALAAKHLADRTDGHTPSPERVSKRLASTMGVSDETLVEIGLPPLSRKM